MIWDSGMLFDKAAVYFQRALSSDRDGEHFSLGIIMGFELLARSALANIHPALLADPQQGENLLYAFGFPGSKAPKSVPIKTVFHRLTVVIDGFTDAHFKFSTSIMEMRNAEIHSADSPFDTFKPQSWLPQLYQAAQILCISIGKTLGDLLGDEDAGPAEKMVLSLEDKLKQEVHQLVADAKATFEELPPKKRLQKIVAANPRLRWMDREIECPACTAKVALRGEVVRTLETKADEDAGIEERVVIMPSSLKCEACGLEIASHGHLFHLGLGDQYIASFFTDPEEYFGLEFDPGDYYEPDYGND